MQNVSGFALQIRSNYFKHGINFCFVKSKYTRASKTIWLHVCQCGAVFSTPVTRTVFLSNCMKHADHSFTNTAISNFERQQVLIINSDKYKSNKPKALKCCFKNFSSQQKSYTILGGDFGKSLELWQNNLCRYSFE